MYTGVVCEIVCSNLLGHLCLYMLPGSMACWGVHGHHRRRKKKERKKEGKQERKKERTVMLVVLTSLFLITHFPTKSLKGKLKGKAESISWHQTMKSQQERKSKWTAYLTINAEFNSSVKFKKTFYSYHHQSLLRTDRNQLSYPPSTSDIIDCTIDVDGKARFNQSINASINQSINTRKKIAQLPCMTVDYRFQICKWRRIE